MPALIPALTDPIIDAGPLIYQGLGRPVGLGVAGRLLADPPAPAHPVRRQGDPAPQDQMAEAMTDTAVGAVNPATGTRSAIGVGAAHGVHRTTRAPSAEAVEASLADLDRAAQLVAADPDARRLLDSTSTEPAIDSPLADWLYARWWASAEDTVPNTPADDDRRLSGIFESARRAASGVEEGLLVLANDGVRLVAGRSDRTLVRRAADAVTASSRPGCAARPGDLVSVVSGTGGPDPDGAWWWAHTAEPGGDGDMADRWYVTVGPDGAPAVIGAALRLADQLGVELSLKCPVRRSGFARRDAFVIYFPRSARAAMDAAAPAWAGKLKGVLGSGRPPFTRALAPGLGAAEDPGGAVSYGQLRCAQVAAALARVGTASARAPRLDALAAVGIDPARPEAVQR